MIQTRKSVVLAALGIVVLATGLRAQQTPATDAALAERFYEFSQQVLAGTGPAATQPSAPSTAQLQQSAALLKAAARANPAEPRYPRLLAQTLVQLADDNGAIEAMKDYRGLRPADQGAQVELISLYLERIETLQGRMKYVADIAERESVPREVRSAIARRGAELMLEKGDEGQALTWADKALALNPLDGRAMRIKHQLTAATATPGQRVAMLLGMLRANPAQLLLIADVAREMSLQGMVSQSKDWYSHVDDVASRLQVPVPYQVGLNRASEMILGSDAQRSIGILDQITGGNPADYTALVLRIVAEKHRGKPDDELTGKLKAQAWNALVRRALTAAGEKPPAPTTRPADEPRLPAPDVAAAAAALKPEDTAKKDPLRQAVEDLAWFAVYMDRQPDVAQKLLAQIAPLVEPADAQAARIAGWVLLTLEKKDEARVKLSAVADQDPLAALGLVKLTENPEQAKAQGQKLLARQPAGVLGAVLWDGLADAKLECRVMPSADAGGIIDALEKFPKNWMDINSNPTAFYALRGEPLKIVHRYGEPILGRVTIQNTSDLDIALGPDGAIQGNALVEVQPQGFLRQSVGPVSSWVDMTQWLVLRPRQSVSAITRLDQRQLAEALDANPVPVISLGGNVRTNVLPDGRPGPAGEGMLFTKPFERSPFPVLDKRLDELGTEMTQGKDRISAIELAARLAPQLLASPADAERAKAKGLMEKITACKGSPDAAVRGWAGCMLAELSSPAERPQLVLGMVEDKDWRVQLLSLVAMESLPGEQQKAMLAQAAEKASDGLVKELAQAALKREPTPPATRPATQPAGAGQ